jgi:hypothetical protein
MVALDSGNYDKASEILSSLWSDEKTNKVAHLYALSLAGNAKFPLFDLIQKALSLSTSTTKLKGDDSLQTKPTAAQGQPYLAQASSKQDSILNQLSTVLQEGGVIEDARMDTLKKAVVDILSQAPNPSDKALYFQRCLTGGIFASARLTQMTAAVTAIQDLMQSLPTKLKTAGTTCNATTDEVDVVEKEIEALFTSASNIVNTMDEVLAVAGDCLKSISNESSATNGIQKSLAKLKTNGDKGCVIPDTRILGNATLPTCLDSTFSDTAAVSGDGKISGCEFFLNCAGGSCF